MEYGDAEFGLHDGSSLNVSENKQCGGVAYLVRGPRVHQRAHGAALRCWCAAAVASDALRLA
jgi:hypothetical protein